MPHQEGEKVVIKTAGVYYGQEATVVAEGEDAEGYACVYVQFDDERSGTTVTAGFDPEDVESGGEG